MDPVSLLVAALAGGALRGIGDTASTAVQDAYQALKALVTRRIAGNPSHEIVLAEHERHPDTWRSPLIQLVADAHLADDPEVIAAAERLLTFLDAETAHVGKYSLDIRGSQGVQVGDHNQQANTFAMPTMPDQGASSRGA